MKVHGRFSSIEPRTSVIDALEDNAQDSFPLHAGDKIAALRRSIPRSIVIIEMESNGRVIVNWDERIAIVIEGKNIVNVGNHLYKIGGYNHDVVDECMYQKMRRLVKGCSGIYGNEDAIDEIIDTMASEGIVAINGD